jgi:hypothetical protein
LLRRVLAQVKVVFVASRDRGIKSPSVITTSPII